MANLKSCCIWMTGLSGAGKSTIAQSIKELLASKGLATYVLDGDDLRKGINKDLGYSENDRHENIRRVSEIAKIMVKAEVITIVALISPLEKSRETARQKFMPGNFIEVYVNTPIDICERRDVKGLYRKARSGLIKDFTGLDSLYQPPANAEIIVDTLNESPKESAKRIYEFIEGRAKR